MAAVFIHSKHYTILTINEMTLDIHKTGIKAGFTALWLRKENLYPMNLRKKK